MTRCRVPTDVAVGLGGIAVGAAVTALGPRDPRRAVAIAVAAVTVVAVLAFAPGRFGADVGAAITFPAGAAATVWAMSSCGAAITALAAKAKDTAICLKLIGFAIETYFGL